ncbi:MAG: hypothetical protein KDJ90_22910 [Nitratireductor sp.]|nr:hypothetical protein [Nitratireductor sp.]
MHIRNSLMLSTSLAALLVAAAPLGALADPNYSSLPAVSGLNGKIAVFGGDVEDEGMGGVMGSVTAPIGERFGLQIDGMAGSADDSFFGVAGHLFWRDPAVGLVGLYGSYASWDYHSTSPAIVISNGVFDTTGAEVSRIGIEGQLYLDRFSLEGIAGIHSGDLEGSFGKATLAFYATDNLRFDVSVAGSDYGTISSAGVEWMPEAGSAISLFADGTFSSDDQRVFGGVKFYLSGEQKSLIRRHREDDPDNELPFDLFQIVGNEHCPAGTNFYPYDGCL